MPSGRRGVPRLWRRWPLPAARLVAVAGRGGGSATRWLLGAPLLALVVVWSIATARAHPAKPAWSGLALACVAAAALALAAFVLSRREREALAAGWLAAWPWRPRAHEAWIFLAGAGGALLGSLWPLCLLGLVLAPGVSWSAPVGGALGALLGAGCGLLPARRAAPSRPRPRALATPAPPTAFLGAAQLHRWQRGEIARHSTRRSRGWVWLALSVLPGGMLGPAQVLQVLLIVLWPLYARDMRAGMATAAVARRLLAATPWPQRRWMLRLLLRPAALAMLAACVLAADARAVAAASWGQSAVLALGMLIVEAARVALYVSRHGRSDR